MSEGGEGQKTGLGGLVVSKIKQDWGQIIGLFTQHKESHISQETSKDSIYKVNQALGAFLKEVSWDPESSSYILPDRMKKTNIGISYFEILRKPGNRYLLNVQTGFGGSNAVIQHIVSNPGNITYQIKNSSGIEKRSGKLNPSNVREDLVEAQSFYINLLGTLNKVRQTISENSTNKAA